MTRLLSPISALLLSACLWHYVSAILAPKLSTPIKEIRVKEGQTEVVLECHLDIGDQPISYRWLKQMRLVTAELGHSYRTNKKVHLAFHSITPAHAGRYECEASNDAGVEAVTIDVVVESGRYTQKMETYEDYPNTENMLSELATSLNDVLAEGNCECDVMFLLHASPDAPDDTMKVQANFVYAISKNLISDSIRIAVMTYSDYVNAKMNFGIGTSKCALQEAFRDLSHEKWATRIDPVLRDAFKKFRKSKKKCKVIVLPIFGSLGAEGAINVLPIQLKKSGVKIFVLEVSNTPILGIDKLASMRGDGHPYHFRVHMKRWPTIVTFMGYMSEELTGCMVKEKEIPGVCVNPGSACTQSTQCEGIGYGCVQGVCQSLNCTSRPDLPGCCKTEGDFWCGDVTYDCQSKDTICDGKLQCMNGLDEDKCWKVAVPCQTGQYRCQTSVLCLPAHALCDGEPHCPGAEDEDPRFCWLFPCPNNRPFRCHDGKCISTDSLCDGVFRDCAGGEDENLEYCSHKYVCPASRPFVCDYGVCMTDRVVCDGTYNCLDAMDEIVCSSQTCPAERPFKCGDGKCIELSLVCNGVIDACLDGSDEHNCTAFICPSSRSFKCMNGRCIDRWLECNKRDDCGDNSDELRCEPITTEMPTVPPTIPPTIPPTVTPSCMDDEFFCTNGPCLSREDKICNGVNDCPNGDDEEKEMCDKNPCPTTRPHRCPDGVCVDAILCDGNSDCPDGSDEEECFDNDYQYAEYDAYFGNYTVPSTMPPHTDDDATLIENPHSTEGDDITVAETGYPSGPKKDSLPVVAASGSTHYFNTSLLCILILNLLFK